MRFFSFPFSPSDPNFLYHPVGAKSQHAAQCIQKQVIHIKASHPEDQLGRLNAQAQAEAEQKGIIKLFAPAADDRQKEPARHETYYVTRNI